MPARDLLCETTLRTPKLRFQNFKMVELEKVTMSKLVISRGFSAKILIFEYFDSRSKVKATCGEGPE